MVMAQNGGRPENAAEKDSLCGATAQDELTRSTEGASRPGTAAQNDDQAPFDKQRLLFEIESSAKNCFQGMNQYGFRFDFTVESNRVCMDKDYTKILTENQHINWWHNTINLVAVESAGRGNCLLNSCSLFMWGVQDHNFVLRGSLYRALTTKDDFQRKLIDYFARREQAGANGDFIPMAKETLKMAYSGLTAIYPPSNRQNIQRSLEEYHIFATANILRRPIIVYGLPQYGCTLEGVYLPILRNSQECVKSPILIGFVQGHFVPLMRQDQLNRESDASSLPSKWKTSSVCGAFSDKVPLLNIGHHILAVKYLFKGEDITRTLQSYLNVVVEDNMMFAVLNDVELPAVWLATRSELIKEFADVRREARSHRTEHYERKRDDIKPASTILPESKTSLLIKYIQTILEIDVTAINRCGFRFPRGNQNSKNAVDEVVYAQLLQDEAINRCKGMCRLLPVRCAGSTNNMTNAISLFLWGIHDHNYTLRKKLHKTLTERSELNRKLRQRFEMSVVSDSIEEKDKLWQDVTGIWSPANMNCMKKILDPFHLFALANVLQRPIIVYAGSFGVFRGVYLPALVHQSPCVKSPILLAQLRNGLLLPLMRTEASAKNASASDPVKNEACDQNGNILPHSHSNHVPIFGSDSKMLDAHFLEPGVESLEWMHKYMDISFLDDGDVCAVMADEFIIKDYRRDLPEDPKLFEDSQTHG